MKNELIRFGSKVIFKAKKHAPEILLVGGLVTIGIGVYEACTATLRLNDILDEAEETKKTINDQPIDERYSEEDRDHDLKVTMVQTGVKIVKNYALSGTLLSTGAACILASYGIIKKRNIALTAAYNILDNSYKSYRDRVKDEVGEEKEHDIFYNLKKTKIEDVVEEDGKQKKVKREAKVLNKDGQPIGSYTYLFDEYNSTGFDPVDRYSNVARLIACRNYANSLLHSRGHLFLFEIFDMLGRDRTPESMVVGWVLGNGDDCVDFGIDFDHPGNNSEVIREFLNAEEPAVWLSFNVDGVIYDKI